jgi:hypothetical protein
VRERATAVLAIIASAAFVAFAAAMLIWGF